jgi:hypothetical protein
MIAAKAGYLTLLAGLVMSVAATFFTATLSAPAPDVPQSVSTRPANLSPDYLASQYADLWTDADTSDLIAKVDITDTSALTAAKANSTTKKVIQGLLLFVMLTIASLIMSAAVARYVWLGRFRFLVFSAADAAVDGLRHSWREALQRWRWRLERRESEEQSYNQAVEMATKIDNSPLIDMGHFLGDMEFRGHLLGPLKFQRVKMSIVDLLQHVKVFGGSGEGKSRRFYRSIVRQLLELRKKGFPIAIYATDDKGAIGKDILKAARAAKLPESDLITIGTKKNDWRIDLLDGVDPIEFADIIQSVAKQAGGGSGADDFWPDMASDLLLNVAMILQAAERTEKGEQWVEKNGIRMYSIMNILRVASNDIEIEKSLQIVIDAMQDKRSEYQCIADLDRNGLHASIDYLIDNWLDMVDATKHGIRANARKSLRLFAFKDDIAAGYATGSGDKLIPASEILSNKVKIINISQVEHGRAGRLVGVMLKTLFFKQARAKEQRDPEAAEAVLDWWFNPKLDDPQKENNVAEFFIGDEYQTLATASTDDGLSDATVWNVLRSACVGGIILSQSVSAYKLAVGEKAAANLLSNFRSLLVFRTEDPDTIQLAKTLAGKTMRFYSSDWNHMESAVAVKRETGISAESLPFAKWNDQLDDIPVFFTPGLYDRFEFAGFEQAYEVDQRFIPSSSSNITGQNGNGTQVMQARQAAAWRQEDRTAAVLQHGINIVDCFEDGEQVEKGRARPFAYIQRAGLTRVDNIELPNY